MENLFGVLLLPADFELATVLTWRDKDTFARNGNAYPLPAAGCNPAHWLPTCPKGAMPGRDPRPRGERPPFSADARPASPHTYAPRQVWRTRYFA
jgi:hypothetical protein